MLGIDEIGRPSTVPAGNPAMTRVIACLRSFCVDCAYILVPSMQSDTRKVSLLAIENILLTILLIPPVRARATTFVDVFVEFMNQFHCFQCSNLNWSPLSFDHADQRSALRWIKSSLCHRRRSLWLLVKPWYSFLSQSQVVVHGMSFSILDHSFSPIHEGLILYDSGTVSLLA